MSNNDDYKKVMQQMQNIPEMNSLGMFNNALANSAMTAFRAQQELDELTEEIAEQVERRDRAIQRTAEESIAHTRLLEKQLQEVQEQNAMLRIEAATNKADAEASRKATKKANRLSIWAIVLSTILGVGGIVASVLIALYL